MALVVDTGVLYASLDEADPEHSICSDLIASAGETLVIPEPVLVEIDYWLRKYASVDAWLAFCEDVERGLYELYALDSALLVRAARLQRKYHDLPLNFVDASVWVTCETLGERKVATLDRRHFSVLRTEQSDTLEIVP